MPVPRRRARALVAPRHLRYLPRVPPPRPAAVLAAERAIADLIGWGWRRLERAGEIRHGSRQARRFAAFGEESTIGFPPTVLHGVERIEVGTRTAFGPQVTLSTGMLIPLDDGGDPILTIGDRCVFGKGLSIVAHQRIEIGDDTVAGHYVYITDQNHGYEDVDVPIGAQLWKNAPVRIGPGCWLGHGSVILPGTTIGTHVAVAAGSVVRGEVPDRCVVAGAPARIVRRHLPEVGWVATEPDGTPRVD
jgi:acetyltransferase-like isoleucine patch superfamily enzyme